MNKAHIGTMGWSYNFWTGNFYPNGLKSEEFLSEYSKHFDTVEVDNTFYRIPYKSSVVKWRDQASPGFVFSAKFPRIVTHIKMLDKCEEEVQTFIERMKQLQGKLGPLLLQFPPKFGPKNIPLLKDFIPSLPKGLRYAVEVRNKGLLSDNLYSFLRENGIALTLLESPIMPPIEEVTTSFAYIRWEGDRKRLNGTLGRVEVDRREDIQKWAKRIRGLIDNSIEVYGYFSKFFSGHPPSDAKELLKLL
jgi:uncharacterized protein YecE (DUF72 family)